MRIDILNTIQNFSDSIIEKKENTESKDAFKKVLEVKKTNMADDKTLHRKEDEEIRHKEIITEKVEKKTNNNKGSEVNDDKRDSEQFNINGQKENIKEEIEEPIDFNILDLIRVLSESKTKEGIGLIYKKVEGMNLKDEIQVISEIKAILKDIEEVLSGKENILDTEQNNRTGKNIFPKENIGEEINNLQDNEVKEISKREDNILDKSNELEKIDKLDTDDRVSEIDVLEEINNLQNNELKEISKREDDILDKSNELENIDKLDQYNRVNEIGILEEINNLEDNKIKEVNLTELMKEIENFLGNNVEKEDISNEYNGTELDKKSIKDIEKLQKSIENLNEKLRVIKNSLNGTEVAKSKEYYSLEKIVSKIESILPTINEKMKAEELLTEDYRVQEDNSEVKIMNGIKNNSKEKGFEDSERKEQKEEVVLKKILGEGNSNTEILPNRFNGINSKIIDFKEEVINIKNFNADTVKNMKYMVKNNIKELVVKVNPGNLGDVTIKLSMVAEEVKANISTASKEVFNHINPAELKAQLNSENIKVSEVNISLYGEDTTFFKDEGNFNGNEHERNKGNYSSNRIANLEEDLGNNHDEGINSLDIII